MARDGNDCFAGVTRLTLAALSVCKNQRPRSLVSNRMFDPIAVGNHASIIRGARMGDIALFSIIIMPPITPRRYEHGEMPSRVVIDFDPAAS